MRDKDVRGLLAPTLEGCVVALCADFERRETLIGEKKLSVRTEAELRYLNYMISEAAAEVTDAPLVNIFIEEIGGRIGYAHSRAVYLGESSYKLQKLKIKENIAKKLHLLD